MPHRSPARWLAPLALVAFTFALFSIVGLTGGDGGTDEVERPATTTQPAAGAGEEDAEKTSARERRPQRKTYTVKAGDTPSGIAEETGVPLETIVELNPDLDPQTLNVGDKIRIR